ncbi:TPA: hypothetical protein G8N69_004837 [Salmonella enterica]|nr:hypothetical protein [Salmonella enterica]
MDDKYENRAKLLKLLAEHNITQREAAELIREESMRPCTERAVRTWVNDPDKPSSRPCPQWAIDVLLTALSKRKR